MSLTPNELDVLIHYYVSPKPHDRFDAPAVKDAINDFIDSGVIEPQGHEHFRLTEKGQAWLKAILDTPIPKQQWVDYTGKIIVI